MPVPHMLYSLQNIYQKLEHKGPIVVAVVIVAITIIISIACHYKNYYKNLY